MLITYKKFIIHFFFIFHSLLFCDVFDGYTLFTPLEYAIDGNITTYMIDNEYNVINSWTHQYGPASMPYLLPDSSIVYPYRVPNPTMEAGGVGGGIESQSWNGDIIWNYTFSNDIYQHHHDIEPLPNGNVLLIVWEKKTLQEAYDRGRISISNPLYEMWSTAILELNPISGEIDWEWHIWDHLIQDYDPDLPDYGMISEHPELFNINCGAVGNDAGGPQNANADWMHINSVHYNESLDQIIISSRTQNEIYIIDHSTTTEEAASHSGGNSGKGGDFLYRWGNPENYHRGTSEDKILGWQHSANWIKSDFPGGGNIIIFNNNHNPTDDNHSAVIEIKPPLDDDNNYIIGENSAFGPETLEWLLTGNFQTPLQGGVFRLENGNTLITQCHTSTIIEVDNDGNILWNFQYTPEYGSSWIARAQKYSYDYLQNSLLGDLNDDNFLNILDIVILINIILENDSPNYAADLNQDGFYNILDIVTLVNLIL